MANCICGKKLKPGQKYCSRECGGKMHLLECKIIDQKYFNYAVGVLHGKGIFCKKGTVVTEVDPGEAPFAQILKDNLDKAFNIQPKFYEVIRKDNKSKRYQLSYNSKSLQDKLKEIFGEFPKNDIEVDYPREYIAGWFDITGLTYKTASGEDLFMITTKNRGSLSTVIKELKKLGLHHIYIQHKHGEYLAIKEESRDDFINKIPQKNPYRIPSKNIERTSEYRRRGELQAVLIYYLYLDDNLEAKELAEIIGEDSSTISDNLALLKKKKIVDLSERSTTWSMN